MYKCSAKCCETLDSMEDVQRCVENCSESFNRAQSLISQELQSYQASVGRFAREPICSQFTNWTIHAHLRRYSLKDISIKNWDFFAFTEQFSNKPTCGRSSHGLHNCEVTSPRFDWPRVGLLANCPVTIFAVGKLAGPQIDLSRHSLPAIIVWLPFPSTLLTPSIDQWCIGSTLQNWEFAFFCQIQFT